MFFTFLIFFRPHILRVKKSSKTTIPFDNDKFDSDEAFEENKGKIKKWINSSQINHRPSHEYFLIFIRHEFGEEANVKSYNCDQNLIENFNPIFLSGDDWFETAMVYDNKQVYEHYNLHFHYSQR